MDYDKDKVDEYTLALLYLVAHERQEGFGARAWKGFDWGTLERLHEKGFISNPVGKAKSLSMTEEGFLKAEELFGRYFGKKAGTIAFPKLTPAAKTLWERIPEQTRKEILANVWCTKCRKAVALQLREGKVSGSLLVLRGTCKTCGGEATRVIE